MNLYSVEAYLYFTIPAGYLCFALSLYGKRVYISFHFIFLLTNIDAKNAADGILNNNMNMMVTNVNSSNINSNSNNSNNNSNNNNNSRKNSILNNCILTTTTATTNTTMTTTITTNTVISNYSNINNKSNNNTNVKSLLAQSISPETTATTTTVAAATAAATTTTSVISTGVISTVATSNVIDSEVISPVTMAKFLQHELKISEVKHCETCQCSKQDLTVLADVARSYAVATQTPIQNANGNLNEPIAQLCLRCNSNLNSPSRTNSPYMLKLVKSSDSVISETKSSVSDLNETDKLFTPVKKDDLMVNPILSHHRLCERASIAMNETASLDVNTKLVTTTTTTMGQGSLYGTTNTVWKSVGSQRGFYDGGGTALELLNKYDQQHTNISVNKISNQEIEHLPRVTTAIQEDTEDETKPLLSMQLQTNLVESERHKFSEMIGLSRSVATTASVAAVEYVKSPTKSASLMNSTLTGSVNSLWSRTSSSDGAKMFENFNRNLIKTIKAENPKHRGPRLCAMRIQQNGQSNIILDNIESVDTPIVYKRRERLLDEELDDTKDIITSTSTSLKQTPTTINKQSEPTLIDVDEPAEILVTMPTPTPTEQAESAPREQTCSLLVEPNQELTKLEVAPLLPDFKVAKSVQSESKSEIKTESKSIIENAKTNTTTTTTNTTTLENATTSENAGTLQLNREQLKQHTAINNAAANYELLRNSCSSRFSINSHSCTQSSSVSSNVLDYQESVTLRRQQLNRVAEWVQNNTQQLQQQQQQPSGEILLATQQQQQQQQPTAESSVTDHQSSFSTLEDRYDSVSMEKLSLDSGYKTTPQLPNANTIDEEKLDVGGIGGNVGGQQITTYYRRTTRSGLPVAYTNCEVQDDNNSNNNSSNNSNNSTFMLTEQPTCDILDFKYYPKESDKTLLKTTTEEGVATTTTTYTLMRPTTTAATTTTTQPHVDIAQMEYNVKQFLLKQNEWSMRYNRLTKTTTTTTSVGTTTATTTTITTQQQQQQQQQEKQKLYKTVKKYPKFLVPGAVERVNVTTPTTTSADTTITTNTTTTADNKFVIRTPKRTETNL